MIFLVGNDVWLGELERHVCEHVCDLSTERPDAVLLPHWVVQLLHEAEELSTFREFRLFGRKK